MINGTGMHPVPTAIQANVGGAMTTGKDDPQTYVIDIHDDNVEQLSMDACTTFRAVISSMHGPFRSSKN